jgi:threonine/homoserine/homoserine lactone efflux protein
MIDSTTLLALMAVVVGLFLIPGPAVLLVLARGTSGGRAVGVATGLGIAMGDLVHTLFATVGLSAVLMTSALAFNIVKYVGAAYLVWLGIKALRDKGDVLALPAAKRVRPAQAFRQAILMEMLNPKTALFFLAFLPQFVRPANGAVTWQLFELGGVEVAMSIVYTSLIALAAGSVGRWLIRHPAIGRWQGKVIGAIYVGLGLRLAAQQR